MSINNMKNIEETYTKLDGLVKNFSIPSFFIFFLELSPLNEYIRQFFRITGNKIKPLSGSDLTLYAPTFILVDIILAICLAFLWKWVYTSFLMKIEMYKIWPYMINQIQRWYPNFGIRNAICQSFNTHYRKTNSDRTSELKYFQIRQFYYSYINIDGKHPIEQHYVKSTLTNIAKLWCAVDMFVLNGSLWVLSLGFALIRWRNLELIYLSLFLFAFVFCFILSVRFERSGMKLSQREVNTIFLEYPDAILEDIKKTVSKESA